MTSEVQYAGRNIAEVATAPCKENTPKTYRLYELIYYSSVCVCLRACAFECENERETHVDQCILQCIPKVVYVTTLGSLETYDVLDSQHHIRKHHRDTKAEMPPNIKVTILADCILSSQRTVNNPLSFCMMWPFIRWHLSPPLVYLALWCCWE